MCKTLRMRLSIEHTLKILCRFHFYWLFYAKMEYIKHSFAILKPCIMLWRHVFSLCKCREINYLMNTREKYRFFVDSYVCRTKALTSHLCTPLFMLIHLPLIYFDTSLRLLIDFKNCKWLTYVCILLCICYCFSQLIGLLSITWLSL